MFGRLGRKDRKRVILPKIDPLLDPAWWFWDGTRKIKGLDWNNAREAVLDSIVGHVHNGTDSRIVPEVVGSLPPAVPSKAGRMVFLLTDDHVYSHTSDPIPVWNKFQFYPVRTYDLDFSTWVTWGDVTLDTDVTYVDFEGLSILYQKFFAMFVTFRNPSAVNPATYRINIEGDYNDTHYYTQYIYGSGATIVGGRINEPQIGYGSYAERCHAFIVITRDPSGYFRFTSTASVLTGSSVYAVYYAGTKTAVVDNISTIRIKSTNANGIGAGSKIILSVPRSP